MGKRLGEARRVEDRLLLDCARTSLPPAVAERVQRSLHGEVDWEYLLNTASWHGVLPLLCKHLNRLSPEAVPSGGARTQCGRGSGPIQPAISLWPQSFPGSFSFSSQMGSLLCLSKGPRWPCRVTGTWGSDSSVIWT